MADKKYFYALGRRKTSTATVRLFEGKGDSIINEKKLADLYPSAVLQKQIVAPIVAAELDPKDFYFTVKAHGGGFASQLGAVQLGIARAIVAMDETKKSLLKKAGFMTRDPRMVERKKAGLRKARKAEQYSKR